MRRFHFAILAAAFALSLGNGFISPAQAASSPKSVATPCRDAKGKFTKCKPAAKPAPKKTPCRDAKGRFTKCK